MKKKKSTDNGIFLLLISVGVAISAIILWAMIMAIIAYFGKNPSETVGVFSLIALILSAFTTGLIITRLSCDDGIKFTLLASLALILILLLITVIAEKGNVPASAFLNYGCFIGISVFSAFIGRKKDKKRRRR